MWIVQAIAIIKFKRYFAYTIICVLLQRYITPFLFGWVIKSKQMKCVADVILINMGSVTVMWQYKEF